MRVALFGGSFDPIHRGHLAVALAAADSFSLDQVLLAPAGRQPLKANSTTASYDQRLEMCRIACLGDSRLCASDLDQPRPDGQPNYTIDALERLTASMPAVQLFNIIGADSFQSLPRWRQPERLLELAEWIVVSRPGYTLNPAENPSQGRRIHLLTTVHEDVSATLLRQRLAQGDACQDLLPDGVPAYILQHHLYLA